MSVVSWFMVFIATFKHISAISWQSVLLVEETGENHNVSGDDESIVIGFTSTFIFSAFHN
jgi:hypothetical protein